MTDHLEHAAVRAFELAEELAADQGAYPGARIAAAAHLTYLAGLIRGGAVQGPTTGDRPVVVDCPAQGLRALVLSGPEPMCGDCRVVGPDRKPLGWDDGRPTETSAYRPADMTETQLRTALIRAERERDHLAAELRDTNTHLERTSGGYRQRWHQAADQRDALVRAGRDVWNALAGLTAAPELPALREVVKRVEDVLPLHTPTFEKAYALRRELWDVLGLKPGTDEDLIAAVRQLQAERDEHESMRGVHEQKR
jgi:hypothetical protein